MSKISETFPTQKSLKLSKLLKPKKGEAILLLGYEDLETLQAWQEAGVKLLVYTQSEKEAVKARKAGVRAVLAQLEYLSEQERFDGIVLLNPDYRIFELERAILRLTQALKRGGRLLMELPLSGHRESSEALLNRVLLGLGRRKRIEEFDYPEAKSWRHALEKMGIEAQEDRIIYRYRTIPQTELKEWFEALIDSRGSLLEKQEIEETLTELQRLAILECEQSPFSDEEVLLRVVGVRT